MVHVHGAVVERFTARTAGVALEDLVAVAIDVGKQSAWAMACDFTGSTVVAAFEFELTRSGVVAFQERISEGLSERVQLVRVGVEAAGHYHLPLTAPGVLPETWELVVLNPAHVAAQRKVNGQRGVKTDRVDLAAITDLLLAGRGHRPPAPEDALVQLAGWVSHRQRRQLTRRSTIQQLTTQVDRCFPGLGACLSSVVNTQAGRLVLTEFPDPARLQRLGPARLRRFAARRGVRMTTPMAEKLVLAAVEALPTLHATVARDVLVEDLALLDELERQIAIVSGHIEQLLPDTPYAVMRSVPGWGPFRVAAYAAAVGDPTRWPGHRQIYRASGLTPFLYESSGHRRDGHISREGSVPLRRALVELGTGLRWQHSPSRAYAAQLRERGKPGAVITIALAHRATKIAYAMVRDQAPFNPAAWEA